MSPKAVEGSVMTGGPHGPVTPCQVQMDAISAPSSLQSRPDLHLAVSLESLSHRETHLCHDLEVSLPPL